MLSLSGFGIRVMIASWSEFKIVPSSAIFLKSFFFFFLMLKEFYLVAQLVKTPPAMQEAWVRSLDWEGP